MPERIGSAAQWAFVFIALFLCTTGAQVEAYSSEAKQPVRNARLESIAKELTETLKIRARIQVVIVPENDRIVSVEPFLNGEGYRVEFESAFFDQLNEEEIVASLAHEMGHVWIFSHPPSVQSEALANEIALKVVPRKPMETLYTKLWKYLGVTGNLQELLGAAE